MSEINWKEYDLKIREAELNIVREKEEDNKRIQVTFRAMIIGFVVMASYMVWDCQRTERFNACIGKGHAPMICKQGTQP